MCCAETWHTVTQIHCEMLHSCYTLHGPCGLYSRYWRTSLNARHGTQLARRMNKLLCGIDLLLDRRSLPWDLLLIFIAAGFRKCLHLPVFANAFWLQHWAACGLVFDRLRRYMYKSARGGWQVYILSTRHWRLRSLWWAGEPSGESYHGSLGSSSLHL